jgi:hypothetical protein
MPSRNLFLIISIAATAATLYLAGSNLPPVALSGFGPPAPVSLATVVLLSYLCGLASVGSFWLSRKRREQRGEQKIAQWANQDQKLLAEIASDKEKLLEAKIATLDVALKTALRKKSELEEKITAMERR